MNLVAEGEYDSEEDEEWWVGMVSLEGMEEEEEETCTCMRSRCMSLLPRTTLHRDSEQE